MPVVTPAGARAGNGVPVASAGPTATPTVVTAPGATRPATSAGSGWPGIAPPAGPGTPWPPPVTPPPARRGNRLILAAAALAVVLVAGGTTTALLLVNRDKDKATSGAPTAPTSTPASAPASFAKSQPYPADTMLVRVDTGGARPPQRQSQIYRLVPGTDARTILPGTEIGDVLPKWSHSRKQIALTHNFAETSTSAIYVMNADGSGRHQVIDKAGGRVAWSADDKKIAFMKKDGDGVAQIFTLNLETNELRQLTYSSTQKDDAAWSPDGKYIMYWLNKNNVKQIYELTVADPQEPGRRITGPSVGPANDPVYSPNGKRILFTRELGGDNTDIWLVNRDGSGPRQVTSDPAREMDPTWSPDGNWFAFVRGALDKPTIVIERPDGTGETVLTKPGTREGHPCWF